MRATLLLCDYASVSDGKLTIVGGGWTVTPPAPRPTHLALLLGVPWTRAGEEIGFEFRLVDPDGHPVLHSGAEGESSEVVVGATFRVDKPAGLTPGVDLSVPFAVRLPPLVLEPGQRYVWVFSVDGEWREEWRLPFEVAPV